VKKFKELLPEVIKNSLVFICSNEIDVQFNIEKTIKNYSLRYELFSNSSDLLNKIKATPANLLFIDEDITDNIALFCEQVKLFSKNCQITLIIKDQKSKNRNITRLGVNNYIFNTSELSIIEEIIENFVDVAHRLEALKMISLNTKKRDIIGEISTFENHLKQLNDLKDKNSELNEKIEELNISKSRLAAEMRVKHKLISTLESKLKETTKKNHSLETIIEDLKKERAIQEEKIIDGNEYFDFIEQRLLKTTEIIKAIETETGESELVKAFEKIKNLETENKKSAKIFDKIIETLTNFVAGDSTTIEDTFGEIINSLTNYTSI